MRLVASVAALLAVVVACSGGGGGALALVASAPEQVRRAETARFSVEMLLSSGDLPGGELRIAGEGAGDFAAETVAMTLEIGDAGGMLPGAATVDTVVDGSVMYFRAEFFRRVLPEGVSWIRMDLDALDRGGGADVDDLVRTGQGDPTTLLETLRGVSGEVETVGEEEIRGVATTHYRARVDTRRALEEAPAGSRARLESLLDDSKFPATYPVDVWLDADGLPRRFVTSFRFTPPRGTTPMSQEVTMEFFDYGGDVDISPPAPEETIDVSDLAGMGSGG